MQNFQSMNLPEALNTSLEKMGFTNPTPIQAKAIPIAMEGKDILGSAQTGTGKTGAYGIPLVAHLLSNPRAMCLVMTPTRELAMQVSQQLKDMLGKKSSIQSALLIGGEAMPKQFQQLRRRPRLIVGTPGRINDHLQRGSLMLHDTDFLVLDETDRMLDIGFTVQIENILQFMLKPRQTLLFSATLPDKIIKIASKYMNNPVQVVVDAPSSPAENIEHEVLHVKDGDKYTNLITQLQERDGSVIIFAKTKRGTEKLAERLSKKGFETNAIHGDLRQSKRDSVIRGFRNKKYTILVATDVAARGLDIPHVEHVINYDLPQCPEDYIHRIGRTARAGAKGYALCFVTPADRRRWHEIDCLLNPDKKRSEEEKGPRRDGKKPFRRGKKPKWSFKKKKAVNKSAPKKVAPHKSAPKKAAAQK